MRGTLGPARISHGLRHDERRVRLQERGKDARRSSSNCQPPATKGRHTRHASRARDAARMDGAHTPSQASGRILTATFLGRLLTSLRGSTPPRKTSTFFGTRSSSHVRELMEEMSHAIYHGGSLHITEAAWQRRPPSLKGDVPIDEKIPPVIKRLTLNRDKR